MKGLGLLAAGVGAVSLEGSPRDRARRRTLQEIVRTGAFVSSEDKFIGLRRRRRCSRRDRKRAHAKCCSWRGKR